MLFVDNILFWPWRGLSLIFKEIHSAVEAELYDTDSIVQQLRELYMMLETGRITEQEFDDHEAVLLDRLDRMEQAETGESEE